MKSPIAKISDMTILLVTALLTGLTACSTHEAYTLDLMPAPEVYTDGAFHSLFNLDIPIQSPAHGILYATCRKPDTDNKHFYLNERGLNLRLGRARFEIGPQDLTWEEAKRISLLKDRPDKLPLKVIDVDEFGILNRTITTFTPSELIPFNPDLAADKFASQINAQISRSKHKDAFIYVHGYKVVFSNPILVSAELWHFLGYDGAFIAYAWPSTPSRWAYFSDIETAEIAAFNLRTLIEFLAQETNVEKIHIIGYSAGTRVVTSALHQLALLNVCEEKTELSKKTRIGHVILVASDVDRQIFGAYLVDGILKSGQSTSVYISGEDKALGLSKWIFGRKRLGQIWMGALTPEVLAYLSQKSNLKIIDVTGIEGSSTGNGHAYFRSSPWVSSDIFMTLMHNLKPGKRGLVRPPDNPVWRFPENYISRLKAALNDTR